MNLHLALLMALPFAVATIATLVVWNTRHALDWDGHRNASFTGGALSLVAGALLAFVSRPWPQAAAYAGLCGMFGAVMLAALIAASERGDAISLRGAIAGLILCALALVSLALLIAALVWWG